MPELDQVIAAVIAVFDERGELNRAADRRRSVRETPAAVARPRTAHVLRYPGAVLADPAKGRLFVADTGRHRVLVCGLDGAVRDVIGAGGHARLTPTAPSRTPSSIRRRGWRSPATRSTSPIAARTRSAPPI